MFHGIGITSIIDRAPRKVYKNTIGGIILLISCDLSFWFQKLFYKLRLDCNLQDVCLVIQVWPETRPERPDLVAYHFYRWHRKPWQPKKRVTFSSWQLKLYFDDCLFTSYLACSIVDSDRKWFPRKMDIIVNGLVGGFILSSNSSGNHCFGESFFRFVWNDNCRRSLTNACTPVKIQYVFSMVKLVIHYRYFPSHTMKTLTAWATVCDRAKTTRRIGHHFIFAQLFPVIQYGLG